MKSIALSKAIKKSLADRVKIESAVALAKAVESVADSQKEMTAGNPTTAIMHALAAAQYFQAANTGMKLVKTLTENGETKRESSTGVTKVFIQMRPLTGRSTVVTIQSPKDNKTDE